MLTFAEGEGFLKGQAMTEGRKTAVYNSGRGRLNDLVRIVRTSCQ